MSATAFAEGYQVNLLSAKQSGMGHTGAGLKLGAESMHFNPAGMAFMEGNADMSVGVSGVFATATCTHDGVKYTTDNSPSTPIYAYAGFRIYDNLKAGIAVTTPFGNGINWTKNWAGSTLVQDISLKVFSVQPTISWRIIDNLSIGAGLMVSFGNVDLSKGLLAPGALSALAPYLSGYTSAMNDVTPVSVNIKGKSETRLGFNVGAMWDINEHWTLGVAYRSKMMMKVKNGDATLDYTIDKDIIKQAIGILQAQAAAQGGNLSHLSNLENIHGGTFSAEMPCPSNLGIGVGYKPNKRLTVALDVQLVGWSAYDKLEINFHEEGLQYFNQSLTKNYHNAMAVRIGTEYAVTKRFDARLGFYYDGSPVDENYYNPETPGMTKLCPTAGFSFRPYKGLSIDASCMYVQGVSRDGAYTTKSIVTGAESTFEGRYTTTAWSPSIGISYKF